MNQISFMIAAFLTHRCGKHILGNVDANELHTNYANQLSETLQTVRNQFLNPLVSGQFFNFDNNMETLKIHCHFLLAVVID